MNWTSKWWRSALILVLWIGVVIPGFYGEAESADSPPEFYISKNICPFECCSYGRWRAVEPVDLKDSPNGKVIGRVEEGERVDAITGEVHATPGILKVVVPFKQFKRGDTIYILHYVGEGFFKYWHQGKVGEEEFIFLLNLAEDDPLCKTPREDCWGQLQKAEESVWWVQMKNAGGTVGWTDRPELFGDKDSCG
ncbi:hypothetical protein ACTRW9_06100 [Nitrospina sp. 32_T5]|uniref:hypothetical protein n=1 Tax=unclassified Nitrospina TaxID=2638683 RepID=UPI003F97E154